MSMFQNVNSQNVNIQNVNFSYDWLVTMDDNASFKYFEEAWLDGCFPPQDWNYFNFDGRRTNNRLEGWHNRFK